MTTQTIEQVIAERDAALAVIEQVRMARNIILGAQSDMLRKRPDMDALEEIAMNERHIDEALSQSPASALAKVKADALREAADRYRHGAITFVGTAREYTQAWLRVEADRIEKEAL